MIISGSRADYYLLTNLKNELKKNPNLNINFLTTGGAFKIRDQKLQKNIKIKFIKMRGLLHPKQLVKL